MNRSNEQEFDIQRNCVLPDLGPDIQLVQTSRNSRYGEIKGNIQAAEQWIGPCIKESRLCRWLYNAVISVTRKRIYQSINMSETDIASIGRCLTHHMYKL